ncbi:hypothetical protein E2C01_098910 [Portunus trituberculatus]|uniref:Uncharacterized protein n=1 Tax=Portunus trituberculatus TaxID=210409 RepID=A0A5B7K2F9_PORTR|nr:hypothetical protein [Portunus trituberculatus]
MKSVSLQQFREVKQPHQQLCGPAAAVSVPRCLATHWRLNARGGETSGHWERRHAKTEIGKYAEGRR